MTVATCRLETDETEIVKRVDDTRKISEWNLADAIVLAIKAHDASAHYKVKDRVIELLKEN